LVVFVEYLQELFALFHCWPDVLGFDLLYGKMLVDETFPEELLLLFNLVKSAVSKIWQIFLLCFFKDF